jgi:hypothetical protein
VALSRLSFLQRTSVALVALGIAGCATTKPPVSPVPLAPDLAPFLILPTAACGVEDGEVGEVLQAHRTLLADLGRAGEVEALARERAARRSSAVAGSPDASAWTVLVAQSRFARADREGARAALATVTWGADCGAAWLLAARLAELSEDWLAALEGYRRSQAPPDWIAARIADVLPRVTRLLAGRIDEEIARGRPEIAESLLLELETAGASAPGVARAEAAVAAALRDGRRELAALRRLAPTAAEDAAAVDRWSDLELELGDPSAAVRLLEELVARQRDDPRWARKLERGKFRWRLSLLPPRVGEVLQRQLLTRADLAVIIQWVMPGVRHARASASTIATDVVAHPWREEIVRILNLGILDIDEALHNFWPARPSTRGEAMGAVLRAAAATGRASCGIVQAGDSGREAVCRAAQACGLIATVEECLPGAPVSGSNVVDWLALYSGVSTESPP